MRTLLFLALISPLALVVPAFAAEEQAEKPIYPIAIFPFEERDANVKEYGEQVGDLLFAELASNPTLYLVDRKELDKSLGEQSLNVSGLVKPGEAVQVGQLTGAKLLISGSVMQIDRKLVLVAKIMGTETTRVAGTSVKGAATDDLSTLVESLAKEISAVIEKQSDKLVAQKVATEDRVKKLKEQLGNGKRPKLRVAIEERHVGIPTIDPAAETEISLIANALGFEILDAKQAGVGGADVVISGEGFSETLGRIAGLVSVKARVEIKAVDQKTGKVILADRQTAVVVDGTEHIAGKSALQEAASQLADRLMPALVSK